MGGYEDQSIYKVINSGCYLDLVLFGEYNTFASLKKQLLKALDTIVSIS